MDNKERYSYKKTREEMLKKDTQKGESKRHSQES
jgi:hypothetical protein